MVKFLTLSEVAETVFKKPFQISDLPTMVSHIIDLQPDKPFNEKVGSLAL
jgi:hypothetical protein